jgi:2-(1,2-epoxy-1,2-dihydrophenyl)acetyl-CoA isomerase
LACADLIYMSSDAWLGFFFARNGIIPEFACTFLLPLLVGFQKAKEIIYFGEKITAQRALELNLVNKVLPPEDLITYTREQAIKLIPPKGATLSLKLIKKTMHVYFRDILERTLDLENRGLRKTFASKDFNEFMRAVKEKRDPVFIGR